MNPGRTARRLNVPASEHVPMHSPDSPFIAAITAFDQQGRPETVSIPRESPLTVLLDGRAVVTLMTLGAHPKELALGYIRTHLLVERLEDVATVTVGQQRDVVTVRTVRGTAADAPPRLFLLPEGSGCGQEGPLPDCVLEVMRRHPLTAPVVRAQDIRTVARQIPALGAIRNRAGSVHGCGLFLHGSPLLFVEDVGRHNAADVIAGHMWLHGLTDPEHILYTTGRLTTEIVLKAATMRVGVLVSRSGITQMALELAEALGMTVAGRAKASGFLVYAGAERVAFDPD